MKLRGWILAIMLLTAAALASFAEKASAGPRVGNGGGIWLCRDQTTFDIRWTKLIDLFEAESEYGLKVASTNSTDEWQIYAEKRELIRKSIPRLEELLAKHEVNLRDVINFTPGNGALAVINDGFYRVRPDLSDCKGGYIYFGQIANFTEDGRLLIAGALWYDPSFSYLDRAGVFLHEQVYKALREEFGDRNSVRARAIVGTVFSTLSVTEMAKRIDAILEQPAPPEDEGKTDAPRLFACGGKVEAPGKDGKLQHKGQVLTRSGHRLTTKIDEFQFHVVTDGLEGSPTIMEIIDFDSGTKAQLDANMLAAAFQNNQPIALSLNGKGRKHASLTCWTEQHWRP